MASSKEKFQLVFEAKEAASAKIRTLNKQLADLGGPKMVKSQKEIKKLERNISMLSGKTKKGHLIFSRFTQGIAMGNIIANAASVAFRAVKEAILGTLAAAGNTERQWNMVTAALERHNLATTKNILATRQFADSMQTLTGVADEEFGRAVQTMVDRGASLSQAFKLVAATADVAASKNKDMKRVLNEVADVIGRKDLLVLEKYGVQVDTNADFTTQLDQAITSLNQNFGGAASDVAADYTTRMAVLGQKFGDLQEKIGTQVLPIMTEFANTLIMFVDEFSNIVFADQFNEQGQQVVDTGGAIVDTLKNMQSNMTSWVNIVVGGGNIIVDAMQVVVGAIETVLSPVASSLAAWTHIIHGDFNAALEVVKSGWGDAADIAMETSGNIDELTESYNQFMLGLTTAGQNDTTISSTIVGSTEAAQAAINAISVEIPKMAVDIGDALDDSVNLTSKNVTATVNVGNQGVARMGAKMAGTLRNSVSSMTSTLMSGRATFSDIFKGIANDFMTFFIEQALSMVVNMLIPGLGSLLGGIFDTPVNDRMAARQGKDFMMWFTRGALAEAQGGSILATGLTQRPNRITPSVGSGGSGATGTVIMNVNVSGNVLSSGYVEKTLAPQLQKLIVNGRSRLSLKNENRTGRRDVNIN